MRRGSGWLAALLAVSLAACSPRAPQRTVVEFWQPFEAARYDSLVARFERENPSLSVHVREVSAADMRDTLAAALANRIVPDLCVLDSTVLPSLLESGQLSDWSAGVADLRDSLSGWEPCRVGDAIYGMPGLLDTRVLFYDERAFERAGLDPAEALADWDAIERTVARLGKSLRVPGWGLARDQVYAASWPCVRATGEPDSLLAAHGVPGAIGLQRLVRIRHVARVASQDSLELAFVRGELPLLLAGPRLASRLGAASHAPRWSAVVLPAANSPSVAAGASAALASFTRSAHKEGALRFARHLVSPASAQEAAARFPEWLPSSRESWPVCAATPALAAQPYWTAFGPASARDVRDRQIWTRELTAALFGELDARVAMAAIAAALDSTGADAP
ncbi:MAG: extracellular solute-binding protein [Candidatus Eisenbacteria bacterium]|nr:extracellular solute-binding protein [Candidatus Eisenbacteria bacterium]